MLSFRRFVWPPTLVCSGIIDQLQRYTLKKKAERFLKTTFWCQNGQGLSAIRPDLYLKRFVERVVVQIIRGVDAPASSRGSQV